MSDQSIDMISPRVLFEDNHLIIVNKLPGEIVQGDKTGDEPMVMTVKNYLKCKYNKPGDAFLGLVHRIDRPVSGAVIFAKTSKALSRMTQLIKNREFIKIYLAITDIMPPPGEQHLKNYLKKNEAANKSIVVASDKDGGKLAELSYTHRASGKTIHLLEVNLFTGRHHQIRAQLAAAGLPIRGDVKYGARRPNKDGSIDLHAYKIIFNHPVGGKRIEVIAPPPKTPEWIAFSSWADI